MASLIKLSPAQNKVKAVKHDLLNDAVPFTEDELRDLLEKEQRQELMMALRSCLRHVCGRFLAHYPDCEPFMNDMVSEGMLAIVELSSNITLDLLANRTILDVAFTRIRDAIERYLNKAQGAFASLTQQQTLLSETGEPHYPVNTGGYAEESEPVDEDDVFKRDVYDALESIEAKDRIDATILCPVYWDVNDQNLADLLGVSRGLICQRKKALFREFVRLTK